MSSYCKECSEGLFGKDFGDLAGVAPKGGVANLLCERCGWIYVDETGKKVDVRNYLKIGDPVNETLLGKPGEPYARWRMSLLNNAMESVTGIFTDLHSSTQQTLTALQALEEQIRKYKEALLERNNG
jgi:hypothetical protein